MLASCLRSSSQYFPESISDDYDFLPLEEAFHRGPIIAIPRQGATACFSNRSASCVALVIEDLRGDRDAE
jgi:hypothetical protein